MFGHSATTSRTTSSFSRDVMNTRESLLLTM